jgi:glutaminyl-peptide cyclotransferase
MRVVTKVAVLLAFWACGCAQGPRVSADAADVSGAKAMEHVRAQVAFGPRPPGSEALQKCRAYIKQQLQGFGYQVQEDAFEAATPYGRKRMTNLIASKGQGSKGVIALASHYDTKFMEGIDFVGANDGGASTALLLELARVLAGSKGNLDYWFVFFDGEEAFIEWSTFDSTYGSRHLAKKWQADSTAKKIRALILLDMIGDKDLDILKESNSTSWLSDLLWETADKAGLRGILAPGAGFIEDDHIPFLDIGVPSVDIIDLNYGPGNSYHHTRADTIDKVSPESMEKTGKLVLAFLPILQQRLSR